MASRGSSPREGGTTELPWKATNLFSQGLCKWGPCDLTFQNIFLLYKYTHIKPYRGISVPLSKWGSYVPGSKIILTYPVARWMLSYFCEAVTDITVKVLKHKGALPSFTICLLLRESI